MPANKRVTGAAYETLAVNYLLSQGARILKQNFRARNGEIDLVIRDGRFLVFVEVKYRSTLHCGDPTEAVDYRKQYTICRVADVYRARYKVAEDTPIRFDVIAILSGADTPAPYRETDIRWYRDAFSYLSYQ